MRLSTKELEWVRSNLLAARAYRGTDVPLGAKIWEPWKEVFLQKITDELYPQEFDRI